MNENYTKTGRVYHRAGKQNEFTYSDGDQTEEALLKIVQEADDLSIASLYWHQHVKDWPTEYHLSPKRADLLRPFGEALSKKKVLELGAGCGAITRFLGECGALVTAVEGSYRRATITAERTRDLPNVNVVCDLIDAFDAGEQYDFVILVGVLEYSHLFIDGERPDEMLLSWIRKMLRAGGTLLIAIENKLGLKYWAGAPEDHVGKPYVGLENSYDHKGPRTYGKNELTALLSSTGYTSCEFSYPFPDYKLPSIIIRDEALQGELPGIDNILVPAIERPVSAQYTPSFAMERVMNGLISNDLAGDLSNSFLVSAWPGDIVNLQPRGALAYIYSSGRKPQYRKQNIIIRDKDRLIVNRSRINESATSPNHGGISQHIEAEPYFEGRMVFLDFLEIVSKEGWSIQQLADWCAPYYRFLQGFASDSLRLIEGKYLDLTPLNVLKNGDHFIAFDQEWQADEKLPLRYILFRGLYFSFARPVYVKSPETNTPLNTFRLIENILEGLGIDPAGAVEEFQALEQRYFSAVSLSGEYTPPDFPLAIFPASGAGNIGPGDISLQPLEQLGLTATCYGANDQLQGPAIYNGFHLADEKHRITVTGSQANCNQLRLKISDAPGIIRFYSYEVTDQEGNRLAHADVSSPVPLKTTDIIPIEGSPGHFVFVMLAGAPALIIDLPAAEVARETLHLDIHAGIVTLEEVNTIRTDVKNVLLADSLVTGTDHSSARNHLASVTNRISHHARADLEVKMTAVNERLAQMEHFMGDHLNQLRQLTDENNQLKQTIEWYKNTYENRSLAGVAKTKVKESVKNVYTRSLNALVGTSFVQKRYAVKHLLEYAQRNGLGNSLRDLKEVVDKHGVATTMKDARKLTLAAIQKEAASKAPVPTVVEPEDLLTPADMRTMIDGFKLKPLLSVIMPVYNTDPVLLRAAIQSVIDQVYDNWELCIADDGSKKQETLAVLKEFVSTPRINIKFLETNGGISAASNEAIAISSGEYLALFDHDDELTPDALFWMVKEINGFPGTDMIYSDECQKDESGNKSNYFLKPDWSPQLLFNMMYTGHLTVYRKKFLEEQVGFFRSAYDFSQDYDLALRASEHTEHIRHIARVLYYWRQTAGSASVGEKPYARQSNIRALEDAVTRRSIPGRVLELPTANRVKIEPLPGDLVSIVVPTDSYDNLSATIESIAASTSYSNYEIVPVTNSGLIEKLSGKFPQVPLHFITYDKPYNFSDKCNAGAAGCNGSIVIFFNDDVRPLQSDWIENTIEYLYLPGVGGVSPKLIYEDDTIQYAGMVTGVRNLTGTSFHCYPRNSTAYINFPQLTREVSILSGACLAMHKNIFLKLGGFDAVNTPSAHSDVDLSFKIIEAGLRCIYTPYAELRHIGHLSLAGYEKKEKKRKKDPADIFLLQRWPQYVAKDPYFPASMRNLLYHDSPEPVTIFPAPQRSYNPQAKNVIVVCHDLSRSGAPIMLYYIAKVLMNNGYFVVAFCTKDGPLRELYQAAGITVIIDPLVLSNHPSFERFAINFDYIICNTVVNWPIVRQMQHKVHTIWWLQEAGVMKHFLPDPAFVSTLQSAKNIIGVSDYSLDVVKPYNSRYTKIYNACFDFYDPSKHDKKGGGRIVFTIVGSIESRKGHDILLRALRYLQPGDLEKLEINVVGRVLDPAFETMIRASIGPGQKINFTGEVDNAAAVAHVSDADVIVCPSRDDPFPVVLVEGFCMGKTCIVSDATGFAELIHQGRDGFVFPSENAEALADIIGDIVSGNYDLAAIGGKAREVYLRELSIPVLESRLLGYLNALPEEVEASTVSTAAKLNIPLNQ